MDPGSHAALNLGDIAMLQVAVARMREAWPEAIIDVLTTDADRLARHCPGGRPLPAAGRYAWTGDGRRPGPLRRLSLLRDEHARSYMRALRKADLFLVSGRGCLCDAFADESLQLLAELEAAAQLGVPTAMMGQGVGPLSDSAVRARAAEVLPSVELIAVREALTALPLFDSLGVAPGRVVVTGDDALELGAAAVAPGESGRSIGLNLRIGDSADIDEAATEAVGAAAHEVAAHVGAPLTSVPISMYPSQADPETFARLTGEPAPVPATTAEAIATIGTCRVVLTGSYHAAVFALAQGIPAVTIAASGYYEVKFNGLSDQYGGAVPVLQPRERDFPALLAKSLEDAWRSAPQVRAELLEATRRQVRAGRSAYERLTGLIRADG